MHGAQQITGDIGRHGRLRSDGRTLCDILSELEEP
jgi:hypothetical protein